MGPIEAVVTVVAIIAFFGTAGLFFHGVFKPIRYRIDRKHQVSDKSLETEMRLFMDRTENRLRALEQIVTEDGVDLELDEVEKISIPEKSKGEEKNKGRLRNQLKS